MKLEEMPGYRLLDYYEDYVHDSKIDPNAPEIAKKAFEIAKARGQKKSELWNRGIRIDTL
ncbi:MAG: hypothetical protein IKY09_02650 [Methanocorpusculum sp.]|nr:hypothetical protein [Methanocorpusculum sp.]MBR5451036.1 hypothetical protein [Methanocorpusculum sp.]